MSARVFNPIVMSEMRRMIGRSSSDASPASVARVRRDLFGPINHEDAQAFVDRELGAMRKRETEKWGFDFVKETPLDNSRFRWERVTPDDNISRAYALRGLSFLGPETLAQTTKEVSTNTASTASQETTTMPAIKQSHITDYLKKCRKRSMSVGDISTRKVGSGSGGDISSPKVGNGPSLSDSKRRRTARTRQ